ncbi:hypothetical protein ACFL6I_08635 [candidate division KSB1 bacterium]
MSEKEFAAVLFHELVKVLGEGNVKCDENLLYKIMVDETGAVKPDNIEKPKRGQLAFTTDLLIMDKKLPAVVIEVKYNGFSTHDVLTYSTKALKHKEVYPYLRYGMVIGNTHVVTNKFFTHNVGFDFGIALKDTSEESIKEFISLIKSQVKASQALKKVLREKNTTRLFNSKLEIKHV